MVKNGGLTIQKWGFKQQGWRRMVVFDQKWGFKPTKMVEQWDLIMKQWAIHVGFTNRNAGIMGYDVDMMGI